MAVILSSDTLNEAFEAILKQALLDDIEREINQLEIIGDIPYSSEYKKNINKIHKIFKNQIKKKKVIKAAPKIAITAASIALITALVFNPHVQAFVKTIFERIFGQYTQHEFYCGVVIDEKNFNYDLRPQYMPDGFQLFQINYLTAYSSIKYLNSEDEVIIIRFGIANETDFLSDNENSNKQDIYVDGNLYIFYVSTDIERPSRLIWTKNGYSFIITAQIEQEEFVKIAESITFE